MLAIDTVLLQLCGRITGWSVTILSLNYAWLINFADCNDEIFVTRLQNLNLSQHFLCDSKFFYITVIMSLIIVYA
jgi:hypothetical protein